MIQAKDLYVNSFEKVSQDTCTNNKIMYLSLMLLIDSEGNRSVEGLLQLSSGEVTIHE